MKLALCLAAMLPTLIYTADTLGQGITYETQVAGISRGLSTMDK